MRNRRPTKQGTAKVREQEIRVPTPSASYRRRAWLEHHDLLGLHLGSRCDALAERSEAREDGEGDEADNDEVLDE